MWVSKPKLFTALCGPASGAVSLHLPENKVQRNERAEAGLWVPDTRALPPLRSEHSLPFPTPLRGWELPGHPGASFGVWHRAPLSSSEDGSSSRDLISPSL